ncbi:hypothetical protein GWI33_002888 [Rhynchophorus ferrugineus]|uniref:Uncharacterized protein n=1 Tax=Rhynchophorus ferrugineus TaxID=354439 RepID=A0A834ML37_RHYFE|nr:hypothetical protein GWI33_002888 [Rhynchophorus ferrugineus]
MRNRNVSAGKNPAGKGKKRSPQRPRPLRRTEVVGNPSCKPVLKRNDGSRSTRTSPWRATLSPSSSLGPQRSLFGPLTIPSPPQSADYEATPCGTTDTLIGPSISTRVSAGVSILFWRYSLIFIREIKLLD